MTQGASEAGGDSRAAASAPGLAAGTLVADRYRVERLLGEGGMGAVYRAEHVHMRKAVALKVLHPDASEFPEVVARFEREAIAAANIAHPNVVSATDFGKLPDGSFFLVLEYVDGDNLRDVIGRGPLTPERALHVIREIASALVVAHKSGVVHRDLKPENVMLVARPNGPEHVKVFDFGIAKIDVNSVTGKAGNTLQPITRVGTIFGTPDYMAPEQAMGQTVDGRADLYALGVMLFEMLTGTRPFKGGAVTLMRQHILQESPELPPEVANAIDGRVAPILKKMLAKEPDLRYASAGDLVEALDGVLGTPLTSVPPPKSSAAAVAKTEAQAPYDTDEPTTVRNSPADKPEKTWRPVARAAYSAEASQQRRRWLTAAGIIALATIIVGAAAFWSMSAKPQTHRKHAAGGTSASAAATPSASASPSAAASGASSSTAPNEATPKASASAEEIELPATDPNASASASSGASTEKVDTKPAESAGTSGKADDEPTTKTPPASSGTRTTPKGKGPKRRGTAGR